MPDTCETSLVKRPGSSGYQGTFVVAGTSRSGECNYKESGKMGSPCENNGPRNATRYQRGQLELSFAVRRSVSRCCHPRTGFSSGDLAKFYRNSINPNLH